MSEQNKIRESFMEVYKKKVSSFLVDNKVATIKCQLTNPDDFKITTVRLFGIIPVYQKMQVVTKL
jgi:hypothetical protein